METAENTGPHLVSIIILTYNKLSLTTACVDSIRAYTPPGLCEIIVVDNDSSDGTREWLTQQPDIVHILNETNLGFPAGCNQGLRVAQGDSVLLLNNDTVVTTHWLDNLLACLYSSDKIGGVGPVTSKAGYYQEIPVPYTSMEEMQTFAAEFNVSNPSLWEPRLKLIGFCLLFKRNIVDIVGLLDERFSPGNFEDDDYCLRIVEAGYDLRLCRDTFIHHHGQMSFREDVDRYYHLLNINEDKFDDKWHLSARDHFAIRDDLVQLMDKDDRNRAINVLQLACGCGTTLIDVHYRFPSARLYGVERNARAAQIASRFATVSATDVETADLPYQTGMFDYILLADVLDSVHDPQAVLEHLRAYLAPGGRLLVSFYNVMHHTIVRDLLAGRWHYRRDGLLSPARIRYFTLQEADQMFAQAGYSERDYRGCVGFVTSADEPVIQTLVKLSGLDSNYYRSYQYLAILRP